MSERKVNTHVCVVDVYVDAWLFDIAQIHHVDGHIAYHNFALAYRSDTQLEIALASRGLPRSCDACVVRKYFVHILILVIHTLAMDGSRVSCNTALSHSTSKQFLLKVHLFLKSF